MEPSFPLCLTLPPFSSFHHVATKTHTVENERRNFIWLRKTENKKKQKQNKLLLIIGLKYLQHYRRVSQHEDLDSPDVTWCNRWLFWYLKCKDHVFSLNLGSSVQQLNPSILCLFVKWLVYLNPQAIQQCFEPTVHSLLNSLNGRGSSPVIYLYQCYWIIP